MSSTHQNRRGKARDRSRERSRDRSRQRQNDPDATSTVPRHPHTSSTTPLQNPTQYSIFQREEGQDSLISRFVRLDLGDFAETMRFTRQHPEILTLTFNYVESAAHARNRSDHDLAARIIERYAVVSLCQRYRSDGDDFLALIRRDPRHSSAAQDLQKTTTALDAKVKKKAEDLSLRSHSDKPSTSTIVIRGSRETRYETNVPAKSRHDPPHPSVQNPAQSAAPSSRTDYNRRSRDHIDAESHDDDQSESEGTMTPRPGFKVHDPRFKKRPASSWRKTFRVGTVFAVRTFRDQKKYGTVDSESQPDSASDEIVPYVRHMVIVKIRDGFCLACPINTYGGRGLRKTGLRQSNIDAHGRIYMQNHTPDWLPGEPKTEKRDMVVIAHDASQRLHPASRISFERMHTIDYNDAIMLIGQVESRWIPFLEQYAADEYGRSGNQDSASHRKRDSEKERKKRQG